MRTVTCAILACLAATAAAHPPQMAPVPIGDLCASPDGVAVPHTEIYRLPNGATIVFVAVHHERGADTASARAIDAAFARYHPTVVLVEGVSAQKSGDARYVDWLRDRAARQLAAGTIQENLYAVTRADAAKVRYAGWDMSPADEYAADLAAGFDPADVLGAHLLRSHADPSGPAPAELMQAELRAIPPTRRPADFDYAGWYGRVYGKVPDPMAGTPCGTGVASRIVRAESIARTRLLADRIAAAATLGGVVLAEAGANHWLALRDYLAGLAKRRG